MQLQAFIKTRNAWLDREIKTYTESFLNEIKAKCISPVFLEDMKAAKKQAEDQILTYCFCDPTDIEQTLYRASASCMLSFFNHVDCWVDKDRLAILAEYWERKRPRSMFSTSLPETVCFELDYADFLDDKLDDPDLCFLKQSLLENEQVSVDRRDWWILKPAMTDCGYGIRLFSCVAELGSWFEELPYDDTEVRELPDGNTDNTILKVEELADDHTNNALLEVKGISDYNADIAIPDGEKSPTDALLEVGELPDGRLRSSQLRRFIAQRYVASIPLLNGRKFHIRAYVLVMGQLRVFVHREMLVLVAPREYVQPWEPNALQSALTNTSLQMTEDRNANIHRYWTSFTDSIWKEQTFEQICQITADVFEAGVALTPSHLLPHPNCFELFALDFLVDISGKVWLLEVNSGPCINEVGEAREVTRQVHQSVVQITLSCLTGERIDRDRGMVEVLTKGIRANVPCFPSAAQQ